MTDSPFNRFLVKKYVPTEAKDKDDFYIGRATGVFDSVSREPITVHLKDNFKNSIQAIARESGLSVNLLLQEIETLEANQPFLTPDWKDVFNDLRNLEKASKSLGI